MGNNYKYLGDRWKKDKDFMDCITITKKDQVESYITRFVNISNGLLNVSSGANEDDYTMSVNLYKCLEVLKRVAGLYDNSLCDLKYEKDEIDNIFDRIKLGIEAMEKVNEKRALRD